jgi:hypothetical protein
VQRLAVSLEVALHLGPVRAQVTLIRTAGRVGGGVLLLVTAGGLWPCLLRSHAAHSNSWTLQSAMFQTNTSRVYV